jgi:serine/threonine protein kinase
MPELFVGRYELDGIVGRGSMAEVFRAHDIRLDRVVAVKTLREDLTRDATFVAMFRRAAQTTASLDHPSIVAVYDVGEDTSGPSRVPYIVMEFVDGRTLRDLLRDDRRLLPQRALEITDGVLRALEYSHRSGIVHRNIYPGNVMLTRTGEVKVMDFGITSAPSDITLTGPMLGNADYLSPEQARGERVDARTDLYSTGCLLYALLTGGPPFAGDSPVAVAWQHVAKDPVPPSRLDAEIPVWVDPIVLRAMAKRPADRYQSAADMRTDIQRGLSGVPAAGSYAEPHGVRPQAPLSDERESPRSPDVQQQQDWINQASLYNVGVQSAQQAEAAPGGREKRRRSPTKQPDDPISQVVESAVKPGTLTFNPPAVMVQGRWERVEVGVARSLELREALTAGLKGRGEPQFEQISTSSFMSVELSGPAFTVRSFSPAEQLVPKIGHWEFDVMPNRAGRQILSLCVSLRVDSPTTSGRIAVPVLERKIRIRVAVGFSTRRFLVENWQWLIATVLGVGGALAAWVALFR